MKFPKINLILNDIKVIQHTVGRIREYQLHFLSCLQFAAAVENTSAANKEKIQNKCQLDEQKTSEWIFNYFHDRSLGMFTQIGRKHDRRLYSNDCSWPLWRMLTVPSCSGWFVCLFVWIKHHDVQGMSYLWWWAPIIGIMGMGDRTTPPPGPPTPLEALL